jgi:hypothetical protein
MILKLKEVYRDKRMSNSPTQRMRYSMRDIFVNAELIVFIRPNENMSQILSEGLIDGVPTASDAEFCTISLARGSGGVDVTVYGSLEEINKKINTNKREVLHG